MKKKKFESNCEEEFIELFYELKKTGKLSNSALFNIVKFICAFYGDKIFKSVNEVSYKMFANKIEKDGKVVDLSVFPLCEINLLHHNNNIKNLYCTRVFPTNCINAKPRVSL